MTTQNKLARVLRIVAAWSVLAAILACGSGDGSSSSSSSSDQQGAANRSFRLAPGFTPDPQTGTGTAGGPFDANTRNNTCRGFIGAVSNHTLNLTSAFTNLRVIVGAPEDTTLVIQLSNGEYRCNDDAEGTNPIVEGAFPAGMHRIYVGSYNRDARPAYTIGVTELASTTAASLGGGAAAAPTPTPPPAAATALVSLTSGFVPDPQTARGTAGGPLDASQLSNGACHGYIPNAPQHTVMAGGAFNNLRMLVNSTTDTLLVVRGPDGAFRCNDDSEGFNPIVEGPLPAGATQVWVGTFSANQSGAYVIGFSELSSVTAAGLGN
jgi:hypothetical protein